MAFTYFMTKGGTQGVAVQTHHVYARSHTHMQHRMCLLAMSCSPLSNSIEVRVTAFMFCACRLHTIIDCDMVLVMDNGLAAEWGRPATLLDNPNGTFTSTPQPLTPVHFPITPLPLLLMVWSLMTLLLAHGTGLKKARLKVCK